MEFIHEYLWYLNQCFDSSALRASQSLIYILSKGKHFFLQAPYTLIYVDQYHAFLCSPCVKDDLFSSPSSSLSVCNSARIRGKVSSDSSAVDHLEAISS